MTRTRIVLTCAGILGAVVAYAVLWPLNAVLRDVDRLN